MTKVIMQKIKKGSLSASRRSDESVARAKRFSDLALKNGALELESKIDRAIRKSDKLRSEVQKPGNVTVAVS
jgi:hypothetical protein